MRYVTLIDLGAGQLPAQTPPAARFARWFPEVYAPSAVPPVGGTEVTPVADGVLLEWDAVESGGAVVTYIVERSESPDGPWQEVVRTTETRYLYSDGSGLTWYFRITATARGVAGGSEVVEGTAELVAKQAAVDAAMEEALRASLNSGKALALFGTEYSQDSTYTTGSVIYKGGRMYRAKQEVPADTPPPDAVYWEDVGTVTEAQSSTSRAVSQLRVDLDEQGQQFAAAIDQVNSGLASATTTIQAIGGGGNLCPNSFFALDTAGWATGGAPVPFTWERNYLGVSPPGHGIARAHGVAQPNMVLQGYAGPVIGIDPEKWYMASASVGASGTVNAAVLLLFYDAAGAELAGSSVSPRTTKLITALAQWGSLSNYERLNTPATKPPAGAASARILVRPYGTGNASSSVGFTRAMLEECRQDQTAPTAWSASGTEMSASQTLTLDVGGNVSGTQSMNDGKRSSFSILANIFRVITGGAASGMEWQANYIRIYGNGYQLVMGTGFGSAGNLVQWFGANVGAANCATANCIECKTTSGQTIIRGTSTQGRMEITNTAINIYDVNNRRRFAAGLDI